MVSVLVLFLMCFFLSLQVNTQRRTLQLQLSQSSSFASLYSALSKKDIRKEQSESPDFADALMMGIYALTYHSHLLAKKEVEEGRLNHRVVESDFDPFN